MMPYDEELGGVPILFADGRHLILGHQEPEKEKAAGYTLIEAQEGRKIGEELFLDKLAAESGDVLTDILRHCAQDDAPPARLIPQAVQDIGPDFLIKLANLIEESDIASRFLAETYTKNDLTVAPDWFEKKAAQQEADILERYRNSVVLVRELGLAKSASERTALVENGYAMEDYRDLGAVNTVVHVIDDPVVQDISKPGVASVLDSDGKGFNVAVVLEDHEWLSGNRAIHPLASPATSTSMVTLDDSKAEYSPIGIRAKHVVGTYLSDMSLLENRFVTPTSAKVGACYILVHRESLRASEPFCVESKKGNTIGITSLYGTSLPDLVYKEDVERSLPERGLVNKSYSLIELKTEKGEYHDRSCVWTKKPMESSELEHWLRTAGGNTHSKDITVTKEPSGLFSVAAYGSDGFRKVARNLDRMNAHISLVGDYEMRADAAGAVLDYAEDHSIRRIRVFDRPTKSAFVTRMRPEQEWVTGFDPVLSVKVNYPQQQTVGTYTPEHVQQHHRIGDRYMGEAPTPTLDENEDGLPGDAVMTMSPENLAVMAKKYDMPHIFDHQVIGSLAANTYDTIDQVRRYIPDLETGVDRYARILFLLRYRPADFEEAYGKDELMEMEQELSSLFQMAGKSLLRLMKRFDTDKFAPQYDS